MNPEAGLVLRTAISSVPGFPGCLVVKNPPANAGDTGDTCLIPGLGRSPEGDKGNPSHLCLENPMDRGSCWVTVPRVLKSLTWLSTHEHTAQFLAQNLVQGSHSKVADRLTEGMHTIWRPLNPNWKQNNHLSCGYWRCSWIAVGRAGTSNQAKSQGIFCCLVLFLRINTENWRMHCGHWLIQQIFRRH